MHPESAVGVVIVAAGSGSRLGADVPKAFVPLAGVPILGHALRGALSCPDVAEIVVVAPESWLGTAEDLTAEVCRSARSQPDAESAPGLARCVVVSGGAERGDSVLAGLRALSGEVAVVLVHDAARCLTPVTVYERVVGAVRDGAVAVVPGVAVVDTVKQVGSDGLVVATPDRATLRAVQTPQGFRRDTLERAHSVSSAATDDAALVEALGEPVLVVDGDALAFKVTTPADLEAAARILAG